MAPPKEYKWRNSKNSELSVLNYSSFCYLYFMRWRFFQIDIIIFIFSDRICMAIDVKAIILRVCCKLFDVVVRGVQRR